MCLARPVQLVEVDPDGAAGVVDDAGTPRRVTLAVVNAGAVLGPGEWLLMNSGIPIQRIAPTDAAQLLAQLADTQRGER